VEAKREGAKKDFSLSPQGMAMGASRAGKILAAIAVLVAVPCSASAMSGRDLLEYCLSENQVEKTGCVLYITGFV
jgi:hypothetical protein